jgi:hypothetical protein
MILISSSPTYKDFYWNIYDLIGNNREMLGAYNNFQKARSSYFLMLVLSMQLGLSLVFFELEIYLFGAGILIGLLI